MENLQKEKCKHFQHCSAALCPLDMNPRHYWYADTEICRRKSCLPWVNTQRKIQKVNPDSHGYFTVKMLELIGKINNYITGIECNGYSNTLEDAWIQRRKDRHIIHQNQLLSQPNINNGGKWGLNDVQSDVEAF